MKSLNWLCLMIVLLALGSCKKDDNNNNIVITPEARPACLLLQVKDSANNVTDYFSYDADGRNTRNYDAVDKTITTYYYNTLTQLDSSSTIDSITGTTVHAFGYHYSTDGKLTSQPYYALDSATMKLKLSLTLTYTYRTDGRVASMVTNFSTPFRTINYVYDTVAKTITENTTYAGGGTTYTSVTTYNTEPYVYGSAAHAYGMKEYNTVSFFDPDGTYSEHYAFPSHNSNGFATQMTSTGDNSGDTYTEYYVYSCQ